MIWGPVRVRALSGLGPSPGWGPVRVSVLVVGKEVPGPSAGSPPQFCNLAKSEVPPGLAAAVFFRDLPKGRWRPDLPSPPQRNF